MKSDIVITTGDHNEDGFSITYEDGSQAWWVGARLHREDGPAVIYSHGTSYWYRMGRIHRVDGPAVIRPDGSMEWWVDGEQITSASMYQQRINCDDEYLALLTIKYGNI